MTRKWFLVFALCTVMVVWAGCSAGSGTSTTSSASSSQVSLTMTDDPPAGVAVLSFEITISKAVLQPGNVPLISKPTEIEVTQLQTAHALLDSLSVPAGNYTEVDVTLSNADLTIINNSGAAIGSCAIGATCELQPTLPSTPIAYTGAPFPVSLAANSPMGLLLDFNLQSSIQPNLTLNPVITISKLLPAPGSDGAEDMDSELDNVHGIVTAINTTNNSFTLQVGGPQGTSDVILTNSSTKYGEFDLNTLTNGFASIAVGEILKVDVALQADGSLLATRVELAEHDARGELEGVITSINSSTQSFQMASHNEEMNDSTTHPGMIVTVTLQTGATFNIDSEDLNLPSGLTFAAFSDLMVGQEVQIHPLTVGQGAASTDRVRLEFSQITGAVSNLNGTSFTLINLPDLFTSSNPSITSLMVIGAQATFLENGSFSGLANTNNVSVAGLLFNSPTTPTLVAKRIRKLP